MKSIIKTDTVKKENEKQIGKKGKKYNKLKIHISLILINT